MQDNILQNYVEYVGYCLTNYILILLDIDLHNIEEEGITSIEHD